MRQKLFIFLIFSFLSFPIIRLSSLPVLQLSNPSIIRAQEFDYARALSDYIYNYNLYRSAHLEYVSAKSEYQTYQTLTSQAKAIEATKKMLLARAETMRTYLTALRMKLKETTGIINYQQNLYYLKLDTDTVWLEDHKKSLPSAATLNDLVDTSSKFEQKHPEMEVIAYQTLGQIIIGKETSPRSKIQEQVAKTEIKINEIKETGEDTALLERWLIQAKEKIARSQEKERAAQNELSQMRSNDSDKGDSWSQIQRLFEEENLYLKEAVSFLKEIIREIKRA